MTRRHRAGTPSPATQVRCAILAFVLAGAGFVTVLVGAAIDQVDPMMAELFGGPPPVMYAGHVPQFWASYAVAWLLINGAFLVFARGLRTPRPDSVVFQLSCALFVFVTGMALYAAAEAWGLASSLVGLCPGMVYAAVLALREQKTSRPFAHAGSR